MFAKRARYRFDLIFVIYGRFHNSNQVSDTHENLKVLLLFSDISFL